MLNVWPISPKAEFDGMVHFKPSQVRKFAVAVEARQNGAFLAVVSGRDASPLRLRPGFGPKFVNRSTGATNRCFRGGESRGI